MSFVLRLKYKDMLFYMFLAPAVENVPNKRELSADYSLFYVVLVDIDAINYKIY